MIILFHELPNKANSSHKSTFFLGITTLFLVSVTVVWVEILKKKPSIFLV